MICYLVMIQNQNFPKPEICYDMNTGDAGQFDTRESAQEFISSMVGAGFDKKDYFVAQVVRIDYDY